MAKVTNNPISMSAGDTISLVFSILTDAGAQPAYTSPTFTFRVLNKLFGDPTASTLFSKTGSVQQVNGQYQAKVDLAQADTKTVGPGDFYYQLRVVDRTNAQVVADGVLSINANFAG